jgi:hypothetical protein
MNGKTIKTMCGSLAVASALAALASVARAGEIVTIDLAWTDNNSVAQTADFTISLTPFVQVPGLYATDSISGTYMGETITGIDYSYGYFRPGNTIHAPSQSANVVDNRGVSFDFGVSGMANFNSDGYAPPDYKVTDTVSSTSGATVTSETAVFSAVPEPASWALMLVGVGAAGGALRLARKRGTAPAKA